MRKILQFVTLGVCLSAFVACTKTGTCETRSPNGYYECEQDLDKTYCNTAPGGESAFYTDKSCEDLGYGYQSFTGTYRYSEAYPNTNPGPYGKWGSGSGGSGGSSGVCSGTYKSPTTDAQLNAYCGAAYSYRCQQGKSLSDPSVKAVCQYYNDYREPGVPDCGYCK